jgi:hypothetical protein
VNKKAEQARAKIAADVDAYLKSGGKIQEIPIGVSGEDGWVAGKSMQWHQERRKKSDWRRRTGSD